MVTFALTGDAGASDAITGRNIDVAAVFDLAAHPRARVHVDQFVVAGVAQLSDGRAGISSALRAIRWYASPCPR